MPQRNFANPNENFVADANRFPDKCPLCFAAIRPVETTAQANANSIGEVVFRCPSETCSRLFIARYTLRLNPSGGGWEGTFINALPMGLEKYPHSEIITGISTSYTRIFDQARAAEVNQLDEIAGVGYRRSLEFLVKDYLINLHQDSAVQEDIRKQMLGKCIEKYVRNESIKLVAKRAAWLGNDETHYVRKWEDKDINDLKKLILMTVAWIEIEQLTLQIQADMPESS